LAGDPADPKTYVRLEYENLFALGSLCSIDDPQTVLRACQFCDEAGIDTISAGGTIAFAMECVERGWLDAPWLRFGDSDAMLRALSLIAARDGLGDLLADGSRRLSHHIGANSASIAAHVKGLELPGYEPRGAQTMALGFAVGARGADHNRSGAYEADFSNQVDRRHATRASVTHAIDAEDRAALIDSLVFCKFLRGVFVDLFAAAAQMLQLVTGWDISGSETREISERIVATKKYFNMLAGWTPAEDTLPARFFDTPLEDDPDARISRSEFASLIRHYNRQRGWTEEGYLTTELIASLGFSLRDDTGDCG
jgi:aldehyde:ferredoxin oxidoreductase